MPAGFEAGVGVEQLVEAGAVGVGDVASSANRAFGVEGLTLGLSALDVAAHLGESDDMEAVQHMAGVADVDGRLVVSLTTTLTCLHQRCPCCIKNASAAELRC